MTSGGLETVGTTFIIFILLNACGTTGDISGIFNDQPDEPDSQDRQRSSDDISSGSLGQPSPEGTAPPSNPSDVPPSGGGGQSYGSSSLCETTCEDGNPCTSEFCGESTNFECVNLILSGDVSGCSNESALPQTCVYGACKDIIYPEEQQVSGPPYEFRQAWEYNSREYWIDWNIPRETYQYYSSIERESVGTVPTDGDIYYYNYGKFTTPDDFSDFINNIRTYTRDQGFNEQETLDYIISFVQSLEYYKDEGTYDEYPKFPIETLVEGGGDCEDTSILLATILYEMGYDVKILILPDEEHAAVGLAGYPSASGRYYEDNGERYYYIETTSEGWEVGEIPDEFQGTTAYLLDVSPESFVKKICPLDHVYDPDDGLCYWECGDNTYCYPDSYCYNEECVTCDEGYYLATDGYCYMYE